ncbi:adenosylmethionine--8-amino-7-oxononanoate transaminase [Pseudopontixanthobacter vadosimaris]|uniref:adenosylmethionine--8-amino-7-oxononanoate transaminase n=1 Tax=Pseudopontixanthobacter vadosimaris TaxID=2726450 RepID=UPI001472FA14|nr:adenosylmethionine--8-amino-7-oxononanoate transaminase [Pseudopontixanthobacter vadosimaris]
MIDTPVWHPFTQHGLGEPIPEIVRAEGAALYTTEGQRIIDGISSWWVNTHGHCHPRISAAIAQQAGQLDQMIFAGWTHGPAQDLATGLRAIMPPDLTRVFFSDSGSTAVEVALKMALGYWRSRKGGARHRIVVMEHSYHGDTIGAMSVGARGVFNQAYEPLLFDTTTVPFPAAGCEQATLDALEQACSDAAAFIVEPLILGAGGMLTYSPCILAEMRAICARHGVLFIADEVMTGWGRTGTLLACEQAKVSPDILCLSKGLTGGSVPLAVTMATEPVYQAHYSQDRADMFFHSSSYTANPLACAAANANLAIWAEEPVMQRIATLAQKQQAFVVSLQDVPNVENARRCGTIAAFDISVPSGQGGYMAGLAPALLAYYRSCGLLLRPLGNTVYAMPPYCIDADDLAALHEGMVQSVSAIG